MPFRRSITAAIVLTVIIALACTIVFPGRQGPMAFRFFTGIGIETLQAEVDRLEALAIEDGPFTDGDKQFLHDLYAVGAKGGRLTGVTPHTSRLVSRYLDQTGEDLQLDADFVRSSKPVGDMIRDLRFRIAQDVAQRRPIAERYTSETFYLGDPTGLDTEAALYFGKLIARPYVTEAGESRLAWRLEMPWVWPTYDELLEQYGRHDAQNFALPNVRSVLQGPQHMLRVDDGLGGHLPALGLAKPFLAFAEWDEAW